MVRFVFMISINENQTLNKLTIMNSYHTLQNILNSVVSIPKLKNEREILLQILEEQGRLWACLLTVPIIKIFLIGL